MPFRTKCLLRSVQNKAGNFITPTIASVTAAANVQIPPDSKVSLTNTDAPDGYPISGFSWVIIYKEQKYKDRCLDRGNQIAETPVLDDP